MAKNSINRVLIAFQILLLAVIAFLLITNHQAVLSMAVNVFFLLTVIWAIYNLYEKN